MEAMLNRLINIHHNLIFLFLLLIYNSLNLRAQDFDNPCVFCHLYLSVGFPNSAHGESGLKCNSCHGESKEHIHVEDNSIRPDLELSFSKVHNLCGNCHDNQFEEYNKSHHAEIVKEKENEKIKSEPELPGCTACHNVHKNENLKNIRLICIRCHTNITKNSGGNKIKTDKEKEETDCKSCHSSHSLFKVSKNQDKNH